MATSSALETLIDLATRETDDAAKRLGMAMKGVEDAQQKLTLLNQYRDDYMMRFQQSMRNGLTAMAYANYQQFIGKLDQAINGQQLVVRDATLRVERERENWQASERKRMSYGTLAERAEKAQQAKDNKREQKQMDEYAARRVQPKQ